MSSPDSRPSGPSVRPVHRRRRIAVRLLFASLATAALLEVSLRVLVFHDAPWAARLGSPLRNESFFTDRWSDEYWVLKHMFAPAGSRVRARRFDDRVGWLRPDVEVGTYGHRADAELSGRRPVLLYGDSYAACVTDSESCWEGLLERSPFGADFHLINYGTGGYGLDQTLLLFEATIDRYLAQRPIVIVSILVDDAIDRSALRFRGWPKPRFAVQDGALAYEAPLARDADEYVAEHPPGFASYLFRYLVYGANVLPRNESEWLLGRSNRVPDASERARLLIRRLHEKLASLEVDFFVLLFHGEHYLQRVDWRNFLLQEELEALNMPFVMAKREIVEDMQASGRSFPAYFGDDPRGLGHYNELGNEVVFRAIERGLNGDFDEPRK